MQLLVVVVWEVGWGLGGKGDGCLCGSSTSTCLEASTVIRQSFQSDSHLHKAAFTKAALFSSQFYCSLNANRRQT